MTRREFEEIDNWRDLIRFANDIDSDLVWDIYKGSDIDERILVILREKIHREYSWSSLRDFLNSIGDVDDDAYYLENTAYEEFTILTDEDFSMYKSDLLAEAIENNILEDEFLEEYAEVNSSKFEEDILMMMGA